MPAPAGVVEVWAINGTDTCRSRARMNAKSRNPANGFWLNAAEQFWFFVVVLFMAMGLNV